MFARVATAPLWRHVRLRPACIASHAQTGKGHCHIPSPQTYPGCMSVQPQPAASLGTTQRRSMATWTDVPMDDETFDMMRRIISAPSPINMEAGMTEGVLVPMFEDFMPAHWGFHRFKGNAGLVVDTDPHDTTGKLKIMICGHADKIRLQVRHITDDGKVFVDSDSFLPATLLGNRVKCFSHTKDGDYTTIPGTVEAIGAIHFAPAPLRMGDKGIKANQLYLELGLHGNDRKQQAMDLGIAPGDSILLDRPIERCVGPDTFSGAYLDNGLGCFVALMVARNIANHKLQDHVRVQYAFASHEEIGRFGSRVIAGELRPDVLVAVDVNHDYEAAPIGKEDKPVPLQLGKGYTLLHGTVCSPALNAVFKQVSDEEGIPVQHDVRGRDSGTDAMAAVLAGVDCAATSVGFPIRNMHTVSELAHTSDVLASIAAITKVIERLADDNGSLLLHPRLDTARAWTVPSTAA
eukprot:m.59224 g.59224  ORF g.59224 m.59224 type:complete len:463 (+) comp7873_c0_seq2:64-1452(+)